MQTYMTNNKGSAAWMAPEVFEGIYGRNSSFAIRITLSNLTIQGYRSDGRKLVNKIICSAIVSNLIRVIRA